MLSLSCEVCLDDTLSFPGRPGDVANAVDSSGLVKGEYSALPVPAPAIAPGVGEGLRLAPLPD